MPTKTRTFGSDYIRDYNTRIEGQNAAGTGSMNWGSGAPVGTELVRANRNTPDRLLRAEPGDTDPRKSSVLSPSDTVTHWRMTFQTDENGEVVPGSEVTIEYSIDGGKTFRNFYDDTNLAEAGYGPYRVQEDGGADNVDGPDEWLTLVSRNPVSDPAGTGFMMADRPLATGDVFIKDDPNNLRSQFTVCFARGTRIESLTGSVNVEDIQAGDALLTLSGVQKVRAVLKTSFTAEQLEANPKLRPIVIRKGALGDGLPMRALCVSPQHRILMKSSYLQEAFGEEEALIAAVHLTSLPGIDVSKADETVEYFHLVFDKHEIVFAEGAESESFYPGEMAIKAMSPVARQELFTMFPELVTGNVKEIMGEASFMPTPKQQKEIVKHIRKA